MAWWQNDAGLLSGDNQQPSCIQTSFYDPTSGWQTPTPAVPSVVQNIGTTTTLSTTLHYRSTATADPLLREVVLPELAANETVTLTTLWDSSELATGTYPMTARTNPSDCAATETDCTNNDAGVSLAILPDVAINPLHIVAVPQPDGTVVVTGTIHNQGATTVPSYTVALYSHPAAGTTLAASEPLSENNRVATWVMGELAPNAYELITATLRYNGTAVLYLWGDPANAVEETTRSNNLASLEATGSVAQVGLEGVAIEALATGEIGEPIRFTSRARTVFATLPITYTWVAPNHPDQTRSGDFADTLTYMWETAGDYTVAVTAFNGVGEPVVAEHTIRITAAATPNPDGNANGNSYPDG